MTIDDKIKTLSGLHQGALVELGLQGDYGQEFKRSTAVGYFSRVAMLQDPEIVLYPRRTTDGALEGDASCIPVREVADVCFGFSAPAGGIRDTLGLGPGITKIYLES